MNENSLKKDGLAGSYSSVSKVLHWVMAVLILGLLAMGMFMVLMDMSETKLQVYGLHKSFGLLVLALAFVRVVSLLIIRRPKSLSSHKKWERVLSHIVQGFLYLLLFALPVSGWIMSSAGDFNVQFFGINMPDIVSKDAGLFGEFKEVHETLAWFVLGLIALHVAGAMKHHFIDNDSTLARMTWSGFGMVQAVITVMLVAAVYVFIAYLVGQQLGSEHHNHGDNQGQASAVFQEVEAGNSMVVLEEAAVEPMIEERFDLLPNQWAIDKVRSTLSFEASQYGQRFNGSFDFDGDIIFDPKNLDGSKANIEIDISSIKTGSLDRDSQAKSESWFDIASHPKAVFQTLAFTEDEGDNLYVAHGMLTLRGIDMPLNLPFYLRFYEGDNGRQMVEMLAEAELKRLDFGVGQGQWQSEDAIGNKVMIYIVLHAYQ